MLKIRDAKALFAATVLTAPWDLVLFDDGVGWGLTFSFGRYVSVRGDTTFLGPFHMLSLYRELGAQGQAGLFVTAVWILSVTLGVAASVYVVQGRIRHGGTSVHEDRRVGIAFVVAGLLFLFSRVAGASVLIWTSIPLGGFYVIFVGVVFYRGLFRLGA